MIEVPAEEVKRAYDKACLLMNRQIEVRGFRRGKLPQEMLIKKVGAETIKYETFKLLLQKPELQKQLDGKAIVSYTLEIGEPLLIEVQ